VVIWGIFKGVNLNISYAGKFYDHEEDKKISDEVNLHKQTFFISLVSHVFLFP
jgi:hypothetical protein